jgi:hypothetical protein
MKRYLHENCDYTFETLKTNLPSTYGNIACTGGWRLTGQVLRRSITGQGVQLEEV